jgi:ankyrin repeat protein
MSIPVDYQLAIDTLANGTVKDLEDLAQWLEGFPTGEDPLIHRTWIRNAVDCGSKLAVAWVLSKGVDLSGTDAEGYGVVHCAIARHTEDKHEILRMVLEKGAPHDLEGPEGRLPLYMAAAHDDVESCRILVEFGADIGAISDCDYYETALQGALRYGHKKVRTYLASLEPKKP